MPLTERKNFTIPKGYTAAKYLSECYHMLEHYIKIEQFSMIAIYADYCYNLKAILEANVHLLMIDRCRKNDAFDRK